MTQSLELRSPLHDRASLLVPEEVKNLAVAFNGSICSNKGDEYQIKQNIIDVLGDSELEQTLAQSSNHWKLTAEVYEEYWRKHALGLLSGEDFPIEEEQRILKEWMKPVPGKRYLDLGTSTGLYARALSKHQPDAEPILLDFSLPMLQKAREKCVTEQVQGYLLRANAESLPFFAQAMDGVVCGGSLNEFNDPLKVLFEVKRVLKSGAPFFLMYLLESPTWYGKLLQEGMKLSGLHFWTLEESHALFQRAGFTVEKYIQRGIVAFALLRNS